MQRHIMFRDLEWNSVEYDGDCMHCFERLPPFSLGISEVDTFYWPSYMDIQPPGPNSRREIGGRCAICLSDFETWPELSGHVEPCILRALKTKGRFLATRNTDPLAKPPGKALKMSRESTSSPTELEKAFRGLLPPDFPC